VALTPAQLATDMDLVSASIEANDVDPGVMAPDSVNYSSALFVSALRLKDAFENWLWKGGFSDRAYEHTRAVQLSQNNRETDITYATPR
jgi:hypothetical protein